MFRFPKQILLLGSLLFIFPVLVHAEVPTIGVIGGGIGGTASAYFLRQLFGAGKVKIHLYERERIGGRLATVPVYGQFYETGGSIIHPRNKYMQSFVKTFGLKHRTSSDERRMGLYSGKEFVYEESSWSLISYWRLLRRYGFNVYKIKGYIEEMLKSFDQIYAIQNRGEAFNTVGELLNAMSEDFPKFVNITARKGFEEAGFVPLLIDELIAATTQVNYGQAPSEIHKFVGMVSVAGATGNLWAVESGNFKVPLGLLEYSGAQLFSKNVLKVGLEPNGKLKLTINDDGVKQSVPQIYDMIIICAPQANNTKQNIDLSDFESKGWTGNYERVISTILSGKLNHSFFGYSQDEDIPEEILFTESGHLINSVGRLSPVEGKGNDSKVQVWKVFSPKPLSRSDLDLLFVDYDYESMQVNDWLAYPHYKDPRVNDSFFIHDNVFYLNAIEWAASAMEMSAIGAKNVALLAYNSFTKAAVLKKSRQNQSVVSGTPNYEL